MSKVNLSDFYPNAAAVLEEAGPDNLIYAFRNHWADAIGVSGEQTLIRGHADPLRPYVESIFAKQAEILFAEALADGRRFDNAFGEFIWSFPDGDNPLSERCVRTREQQMALRDELYALARKYGAEPTCEGEVNFGRGWTLAHYSKILEKGE